MHNDDTGMRILKLVRDLKDGRTRTFTSGIESIWRAAELEVPIQMCDALSRNTPKPTGMELLLANCLAHGRGRLWTWPRTSRKNAGMSWRLWARST